MAKVLDCVLEVCKFELPFRLYVHFRTNSLGKGMSPMILANYGSSSIAAVLQQGWLWPQITRERWYTLKQTNKPAFIRGNFIKYSSRCEIFNKWKYIIRRHPGFKSWTAVYRLLHAKTLWKDMNRSVLPCYR